MKYILRDKQRRENCKDYIDKLDDKIYEVFIKLYKKNRSVAQNNTYWMWLADMSPDIGYTTKELHEVLKVRILGVDRRVVDGVELVIPKSTTELDTKEMAEYLTKVEILAATLGIKLRQPDDYKYIMHKE